VFELQNQISFVEKKKSKPDIAKKALAGFLPTK